MEKPIPDVVHQKLLQQVRQYMSLDGMPGVLQDYLATNANRDGKRYDSKQSRLQQAILLNSYRQDFLENMPNIRKLNIYSVFLKRRRIWSVKFRV